MRKKSILFIVPSMRGGGSERVISTIVKHLDRKKFTITLALLQKEGKYLDDIPKDVQIVDLKAKRTRYAILKIINIIKSENPNIVFSTLGHLNVLISMLKPFFSKKIKFIARESSIVSVNNQQSNYTGLLDFLYKWFYNNFDLIISQSYFMKYDLIENYKIKENKIKVINNPVDIENIKKLAKDDFNFNNNKINLLIVGRLSNEKNHKAAFEALYKLDEKYHLAVLGSGVLKYELLQQVKKLQLEKRVTFVKFDANPYKYMKNADLLLLTSHYEGFPNVVLEANTCGTPVVAFACPGGTTEIIEDGVNGFLVKCGNVDRLVEKINESSKYQWVCKKIKLYTQKRYTINKIIKEYEGVLR